MEALPFSYGELRVHNKAYMACFSCRRKKTRCDMQLPICGLCQRTGCDCTFPKKRKTPRQRKSRLGGAQCLKVANTQTLEHLLELLKAQLTEDDDNSESASLTNQAEMSPDSPSNFDHQLPRQLDSSPDTENDFFVTRSKTREHRSSDAYLSPPVLDNHATINTDLLDSECPEHIIDIPKGLVGELIDLYFDKIQAWLPMLNRPRFYARYMNGDGGAITSLEGYSIEQAMIFNGIFALSARHSHNPYFDGVEQKDRGRHFAERANALHRVGISMGLTNLAYLHGCILLAFHSYTSGPSSSGWVLAGLCVRLAYALGMNNLDDNSEHVSLSTSEWVEKEELRRAWWLVWELDAFGSTLLRRPYAIDRRRISVFLPVSDEAWFQETPIESALLLTKPSETWKSLQNSQNQDPRAWFLIANYLMTTAHDMLHTQGISATKRQELADSITCFSLSLPKHCQLSTASLIFDSQNFSHSNWIICLQLMLLSARQGIDLLEVVAVKRYSASGRVGVPIHLDTVVYITETFVLLT